MTAPKILIMVLSYNATPFDELMRSQQETWDSVEHPDVKTVYYMGGMSPIAEMGEKEVRIFTSAKNSFEEFHFDISDNYFLMAGKFSKALELVKDWDYQYIFRSNSSSYICKKRLVDFAATLPKEKLYAGKTLVDLNDFSGICISGAGIFLSRDCAEILRKEIDPTKEIEEDIEIGRILRKHGIVPIADESRFDYPQDIESRHYNDDGVFHIRFKTGDRKKDSDNMRLVHKNLK